MSDNGSNEPDLWANTGNQPPTPPATPPTPPATPPTLAAPGGDPTQVQPTTPPNVPADPGATTVQPTTPGPLDAPAGNLPPGMQPPAPPAPPGPGDLPPEEPGSDRPEWLIPAAVAAAIAVVVAGVVILFALDNDDSDTLATLDTSTTAVVEETTIPPDLIATETTVETETTTAPDTTIEPATTLEPTTTLAPTTTAPPSTEPPATDPPGPTPPGAVRVAGSEYPINRSCVTFPLAPNSGEIQVTSHLFYIGDTPAIVERWFDEGASGVTYREGRTSFQVGEPIDLDEGYSLIATSGAENFEVSVNPAGTATDCGNSGSIVFANPDGSPQYTHNLVDACAIPTGAGFRVIGYGSDLAWVDLDDTSGNYIMTFEDPTFPTASGPADFVADSSDYSWSATIGDQNIDVFASDGELRNCTNADLPG